MNKGIRSGRWVGKGGSTLCILVKEDQVIGTYSTTHGRPEKEELFRVNGLINKDKDEDKKRYLIGFVVAFNNIEKGINYFSLTSWAGIYDCTCDELTNERRESIKAVWHHARVYEDDEHTKQIKDWCVFHVNS